MEKQLLTNSSLTAFKTCPKKYELAYIKGIVPVQDSEPLFFGSLLHAGLEEWATRKKGDPSRVDAALVRMNDIYQKSGWQDEYLLYKAFALLRGYDAVYENEPYEVVVAELQFVAPVINPETAQVSRTYDMAGKMDRLIKDANGRIVLLETKTTGEEIEDPASDYWRKLAIDSQVSTYYLGAEASGYKIETCIYDVIRKPTIRPKQVGKEIDPKDPKRTETPKEYYDRLVKDIEERPNFYYARREVPRTASDLSDHLFDVWQTAQTIRTYENKGKFPRYTSSCVTTRGRCPYFEGCIGQASFDDPSKFKKKAEKHQELTREEAA